MNASNRPAHALHCISILYNRIHGGKMQTRTNDKNVNAEIICIDCDGHMERGCEL